MGNEYILQHFNERNKEDDNMDNRETYTIAIEGANGT